MEESMFNDIVKKLIEEKEFEDVYLVYLIKKLREIYTPTNVVKITLLKNLNKRTSLKKGNLQRSMSLGETGGDQDALAVFYPSICKSEEISTVLDKLSVVDSHINHIDILTIFGDQYKLQELINEQKMREELVVDVYAIGSTPYLESYEVNVQLANKLFYSEFKNK